jgi:hypothetical protein
MGQTVNLLSYDFEGSNPSLPTIVWLFIHLLCEYQIIYKGEVEIEGSLKNALPEILVLVHFSVNFISRCSL